MKVHKKGFPPVMSDNDILFIEHFESFIESADSNAEIYLEKGPEKLYFSVVPSKTIFFENLIEKISEHFNIFAIRVDFSKSMKNSYTIKFSINYG